ncbi:hypothetical protein [Streptomyces sp. NPDC058718]|uniref:hypothetical protein n=1 Tax=Streptomyces sp. NPDC058718 TaxID=3346610 RepID=UPI0036948379
MDAIVLLHEQSCSTELCKAIGRDWLTELGGEPEAGKKQVPRDPLAVPSRDSK